MTSLEMPDGHRSATGSFEIVGANHAYTLDDTLPDGP